MENKYNQPIERLEKGKSIFFNLPNFREFYCLLYDTYSKFQNIISSSRGNSKKIERKASKILKKLKDYEAENRGK
jgi:hypothetical protein